MKIGGIDVTAAGMIQAARDMQENENPVQPAEELFGPEYEVTISEEGRKLLGGQTAQGEMSTWTAQDGGELAWLPGGSREAMSAEKKRWGYRDELEELEKQIKVMNAAYGRMRKGGEYDDPMMKELVEQQRLLQEKIQEQKDFQSEEGLKKLKAAQQIAAMRTSQYKGEIDENNRDLVTLLRTVEEAEETEEERKTGDAKEESGDTSGKGKKAEDTIRDSAAGFMKSSLNHEKSVEELSNMIENSGRKFLMEADAIAQDLLGKGRFIKAAIGDKSFANEQIDEMMERYQDEVKKGCAEAVRLGSFGTQVLRDMRDARLQRMAGNPLQAMQATKDGMMQAAADAALGEARMSSIDKASGELAEELQELIDRRNHIDRISKEEEKEEENTGETVTGDICSK